jgi:hypothetical protein
MVDESLLQWVQCAIRCQPLDRGHFGTVLHNGEREAGIDPAAVHQHGARAALAVITALFRAGQVEMVAQRIEQCRPRREFELLLNAVDEQRHRYILWWWDSWLGCRASSRHFPLRTL